jgi:hypothetical protein
MAWAWLLVLACAKGRPPAPLVPQPPSAVSVSRKNVRLAADPDAWPRRSPIRKEVIPVEVTLENHGHRPVLVRYRDFALVGAGGHRYEALPPFPVGGTTDKPIVLYESPPINAPAFSSERFYIAGPYAPLYPTFTPATGPFAMDSALYGGHFTYWRARTMALPDDSMIRHAIPEGRLDPAGQLTGFLYFPLLDPGERKVVLEASLPDAATGKTLARIRLPIAVP